MGDVAEVAQMRAALSRVRRATGLPVALGGPRPDGGRTLRIAELSGAATGALHGLVVAAGSGLGGKSMALSRPCAVTDYRSSRHITHEYDRAVATEGLRSVLAVPVVVRRKVRGVLYAAPREALPLGDRVLSTAMAAARDVQQSLVVRDEVRRLLVAARGPAAGPGACKLVRGVHSELRALAPRVTDPAPREELVSVCGRPAAAAGEGPVRGRAHRGR
ncbi:helix-turn-helix transcriptional regulator [Streptomyces enissocaesilis]|uniref:Helix-turn-helix transcriptional regulator n=1 Tax=Streptomyces enissocaesilis TaxID=332589 RepID=A0ABP6JBB9_9ACTN